MAIAGNVHVVVDPADVMLADSVIPGRLDEQIEKNVQEGCGELAWWSRLGVKIRSTAGREAS